MTSPFKICSLLIESSAILVSSIISSSKFILCIRLAPSVDILEVVTFPGSILTVVTLLSAIFSLVIFWLRILEVITELLARSLETIVPSVISEEVIQPALIRVSSIAPGVYFE